MGTEYIILAITTTIAIIAYLVKIIVNSFTTKMDEYTQSINKFTQQINDILLLINRDYYTKEESDKKFITIDKHDAICKINNKI